MAPSSQSALSVVVTGGIACGKTAVTQRFIDRGAAVFDADLIARELVAPGEPALAEIVAAFGAQCLTANGELDRPGMRARIFTDAIARRRLESILHPRVRDALRLRASACTGPYCVLAIALFAESAASYAWVDRVLVVDVPRAVQLARLMQRDGMTTSFAEQALAAQAGSAQRLALADDAIDNSGSLDALTHIIARLDQHYRTQSVRKKP